MVIEILVSDEKNAHHSRYTVFKSHSATVVFKHSQYQNMYIKKKQEFIQNSVHMCHSYECLLLFTLTVSPHAYIFYTKNIPTLVDQILIKFRELWITFFYPRSEQPLCCKLSAVPLCFMK